MGDVPGMIWECNGSVFVDGLGVLCCVLEVFLACRDIFSTETYQTNNCFLYQLFVLILMGGVVGVKATITH